MPEHLSEQDIQHYHSRGLSPSERLRLSDHIAQCDACRGRVRAADPLPAFDVAAFRAELRVPAPETFPGAASPAPPAWRERLLAPRVLVPAFGTALLLVIALLVQNVSLRREYAASARRVALVSGQSGKAALALQGDRPRSGGMAAAPNPPSGQPIRISSGTLEDAVTGSKPAGKGSSTTRSGKPHAAAISSANTATGPKPARVQPRAPIQQYLPLPAGQQSVRTTPHTQPKDTLRSAAMLPTTSSKQPAVVRAQNGGAAGFAGAALDPTHASKDLPEDRVAMVTLSPEESRLLVLADASGVRSGEDINSDEQPRAVEIISPAGPMIIAPPGEMRWKAVEGAAFYKVRLTEVFRTDTGLVGNNPLDWFKEEQSVTDTTLLLRHALAPGKVYQWDVEAYADKEASKPLASALLRFVLLDKKRAKRLESMDEALFAYGHILEQTRQWERAASQYRAIDPAAANTFDKAQNRLDEMKRKRWIQP